RRQSESDCQCQAQPIKGAGSKPNQAVVAPREAQNLGIGRKPLPWVVVTQWGRAATVQVPPEHSLARRAGAHPRASLQGGVWSRGERAGRPRDGAPPRG